MKSAVLRLLAIGVGMILLTSAYSRFHTASLMADTAKAFLASLTAEQRAQATYPMDAEERFDWHYIPKERKGLPFREMTSTQKQLAHALLAAGLSQRGYIKATTIMSLDDILRIMENGKGSAARSGRLFLHRLRRTFRDRSLGLSRRGSPHQPEFHRRQRARAGRAQFLRIESCRGAGWPAQGPACAGARRRSGPRPDPVAQRRTEEDRRRRQGSSERYSDRSFAQGGA